jgi:hypothetical protein
MWDRVTFGEDTLRIFSKEDDMFARIAVLALVGVSLAGAKTFTFSISEPMQAGQAHLKPGAYSLKVDGMRVLLMDKSGRQIDAGAKIETTDRKFNQTAVSTSKTDGANRLESIQLGGSNYKVTFE